MIDWLFKMQNILAQKLVARDFQVEINQLAGRKVFIAQNPDLSKTKDLCIKVGCARLEIN